MCVYIAEGITKTSEKRKVYLRREKNSSFTAVSNIDHAVRFENRQKIDNVIKTLPKILNNNYDWKIVQLDDEPVSSADAQVYPYTPIDIDKLKESICDLSVQLSTLNSNKDWLMQEESNIDKQISDVLHYIEFKDKISACTGYKLYKLLRLMRQYRRKIKNELDIINIFSVHTCNLIAKGNTANALAGVDAKQYTPRVLESLFKDDDIDSLLDQYKKLIKIKN